MTNYILTTTGFLLPYNDYFTRVTPENNDIEYIFKRTQFYEKDFINDFFINNEVYSSKIINDDLSNYINNSTAKNFYKLLDNCIEVFSDTNLIDFFIVQTNNNYLSNVCYMFLIDFLQEIKNRELKSNYLNNISRYAYLPYNVRYNFTNKVSSDIKSERNKNITNLVNDLIRLNSSLKTNVHLFTLLTKEKELLLTFYKFVLADIFTE